MQMRPAGRISFRPSARDSSLSNPASPRSHIFLSRPAPAQGGLLVLLIHPFLFPVFLSLFILIFLMLKARRGKGGGGQKRGPDYPPSRIINLRRTATPMRRPRRGRGGLNRAPPRPVWLITRRQRKSIRYGFEKKTCVLRARARARKLFSPFSNFLFFLISCTYICSRTFFFFVAISCSFRWKRDSDSLGVSRPVCCYSGGKGGGMGWGWNRELRRGSLIVSPLGGMNGPDNATAAH